MSFELLGDIDWLAAIVGAVAYLAIGAVWYAPPVLGKIWMASSGIPDMRGSGQRYPGRRSTRCRSSAARSRPSRSRCSRW